jgi:glutathione synthase
MIVEHASGRLRDPPPGANINLIHLAGCEPLPKMTLSLGVVMDPIGAIKFHKDSTLAMLLAAHARGWEIHYMELGDLALRDGAAWGRTRRLRVMHDEQRWFEFTGEPELRPLAALDAILMRKDPPVDTEYLYATQILERAERAGTLVINRPRALRDANEKLFAAHFPQCTPPLRVTRRRDELLAFLGEHGTIVLKPLAGTGGASVFQVRRDDPNANVIIETLTANGSRFVMAQRFLPEIAQGDKRILLIDGEPVPYALARVPAPGEFRGNLAAGGTGTGVPLTERDRWICAQVGPTLREMGLLFVGLDVIGAHLTEVNVTSPTCIRELDRAYGLDIAGQLMELVASRVTRAH